MRRIMNPLYSSLSNSLSFFGVIIYWLLCFTMIVFPLVVLDAPLWLIIVLNVFVFSVPLLGDIGTVVLWLMSLPVILRDPSGSFSTVYWVLCVLYCTLFLFPTLYNLSKVHVAVSITAFVIIALAVFLIVLIPTLSQSQVSDKLKEVSKVDNRSPVERAADDYAEDVSIPDSLKNDREVEIYQNGISVGYYHGALMCYDSCVLRRSTREYDQSFVGTTDPNYRLGYYDGYTVGYNAGYHNTINDLKSVSDAPLGDTSNSVYNSAYQAGYYWGQTDGHLKRVFESTEQ